MAEDRRLTFEETERLVTNIIRDRKMNMSNRELSQKYKLSMGSVGGIISALLKNKVVSRRRSTSPVALIKQYIGEHAAELIQAS